MRINQADPGSGQPADAKYLVLARFGTKIELGCGYENLPQSDTAI